MHLLRDRRVHYVALALLAVVAIVLSGFALLRSVPQPSVAATPEPTVASPSDTPMATATATTTASPTPTQTAAPALRAVFLGDRYTAGAQWPEQTGKVAGWTVTNVAEPGMGFRVAPSTCVVLPCSTFRGQVARVAALRPDVVVIAGGEADGDYDLDPYAASTLSELRRALPDATIVVMPPLSSQSPRPYWLTLHTQTLRAAAEKSGALFVDTSAVTGQPSAFENGSVTEKAGVELAKLLAAAVDAAATAKPSR